MTNACQHAMNSELARISPRLGWVGGWVGVARYNAHTPLAGKLVENTSGTLM